MFRDGTYNWGRLIMLALFTRAVVHLQRISVLQVKLHFWMKVRHILHKLTGFTADQRSSSEPALRPPKDVTLEQWQRVIQHVDSIEKYKLVIACTFAEERSWSNFVCVGQLTKGIAEYHHQVPLANLYELFHEVVRLTIQDMTGL